MQQSEVKPYVLFTILILGTLITICSFSVIFIVQNRNKPEYPVEIQSTVDEFESTASEDLNEFQQKLNELENAKKNMEGINLFIEEQRALIIAQESKLNKLKQEAEILRIAKEGDENTVYAILDAYAAYKESEIWKERFIGYFVGVFSSLSATAIVYFWNRSRETN